MKRLLFFIAVVSLTAFSSCNKEQVMDELIFEDQESTTILGDYDNSNLENNSSVNAGIANFTVNHKDNILNEQDLLLLEDKSINAVSYEWNFGNGDTSKEANPRYKYNIHGYYTVTLTITDVNGDLQVESHEILVLCKFEGGDHSQ